MKPIKRTWEYIKDMRQHHTNDHESHKITVLFLLPVALSFLMHVSNYNSAIARYEMYIFLSYRLYVWIQTSNTMNYSSGFSLNVDCKICMNMIHTLSGVMLSDHPTRHHQSGWNEISECQLYRFECTFGCSCCD